jgi:hypothetical protein
MHMLDYFNHYFFVISVTGRKFAERANDVTLTSWKLDVVT